MSGDCSIGFSFGLTSFFLCGSHYFSGICDDSYFLHGHCFQWVLRGEKNWPNFYSHRSYDCRCNGEIL